MADRDTGAGQEKDEIVGGGVVMLGGDNIIIRGLNQNNLKNLSLDIPKGKEKERF